MLWINNEYTVTPQCSQSNSFMSLIMAAQISLYANEMEEQTVTFFLLVCLKKRIDLGGNLWESIHKW